MNHTNEAVPGQDNDNRSLDDMPGLNDTTGNDNADITEDELALLDESGEDAAENANLRAADLDNTDEDGEALNEGVGATDLSGADLDVPGSEADDADEAIGEEDEENNSYSLGADKKD